MADAMWGCGKVSGQPLTASQRQDYLGACRTPSLKDIPPRREWGQGASAEVLSASPSPTAPWTGRIPQAGNPGTLPAPSRPAARLRTACHMRWGFQEPPPCPSGSPSVVQVPGLQGWSAEGYAWGCAHPGLTQGRPRVEVEGLNGGEWGTLICAYGMQTKQDMQPLPGNCLES